MARHAGMDQDLLAMALIGYEAEIGKINAAIAEIRARLGEQAGGADGQPAPKKRTMSAAGRRHIAAAQRRRWAELKKSQQGKSRAKAPAPKKRKMSAAGRRAIIEATKKRWAAYRKAGRKKGKAVGKAAGAAS